jgi:SAM-dependent methyltransferase/3-polyprenyl-4-hydroxybenzoate decarboxylase
LPELFQRVPSIRAFDRADTTTVLGRDGLAREFQGTSAHLVRELLQFLIVPRSLEAIFEHLETIATDVDDARSVIDQALQHLQDAGAVVIREALPMAAAPAPTRRLVLGVTGAIAAAHTPALIEQLRRRGFEVRVAMTKAARRFVQADVLQALTHHRVAGGLWSTSAKEPAPHIALAEWAEVVLIAPASATTLSRLSRGDCSDVVSALTIATRAPVVIAPSMNAAMLEAPAVARNVEQLIEDGFHVLHSALGVEAATRPEERRPVHGSWPSAADIVSVVEHVLAPPAKRETTAPNDEPPPLNAEEISNAWEMAYQSTPAERLPFHTDRLDKDLRDVLERVKRPSSLWDVGTGLGTIAKEAARLGFTVVGTDISSRAIALARERTDGRAQFLVDDVRDSKLDGEFDVVVDRGCFHTLEASGIEAYVDTVRKHTRPGSLLILKIHREDEPGDWRTHRYRQEELQKLFTPWFEMVRWSESTMPGRQEPPAHAWLAVFERREPPVV